MSEKYTNPNTLDHETQYLLDLANAKAAVTEAAQPIYADIAAAAAPIAIEGAQKLADAAGEGRNIGDEAEEYVNNEGLARDLGKEATAFLREETLQPISGEEVAHQASTYLRLHDRATSDRSFGSKASDNNLTKLLGSKNFYEELYRQQAEAIKKMEEPSGEG